MKEYLKNRKIKILGLYIVSRIAFGSIIILLGSSLTEVCKIWDNEHYIAIAQNGYTKEYQTAFFPVIPLIIHFCTEKGLWIINQIAILVSMFLLDELTKREDLYIVQTFAFSPIGFFSMMLYTESLLVFFTILTYYLFVKRKFGYGLGISIGLGVATKNIAAMLFFAVFIGMCCLWNKKEVRISDIIKTYVPATIISCLYPAYLQITFNNWKVFMDCQYDCWSRIHTNIFEELIIQWKVIFSSNQNVMHIFKINEIITILILGFILYGLYYCCRLIKERKCNIENILVIILYMFFSILAINSTIRIPYINAPTTSFYRYYYGLFPIYIFFAFLKGKKRQGILYCSVCISFFTAALFSMNFYFY